MDHLDPKHQMRIIKYNIQASGRLFKAPIDIFRQDFSVFMFLDHHLLTFGGDATLLFIVSSMSHVSPSCHRNHNFFSFPKEQSSARLLTPTETPRIHLHIRTPVIHQCTRHADKNAIISAHQQRKGFFCPAVCLLSNSVVCDGASAGSGSPLCSFVHIFLFRYQSTNLLHMDLLVKV